MATSSSEEQNQHNEAFRLSLWCTKIQRLYRELCKILDDCAPKTATKAAGFVTTRINLLLLLAICSLSGCTNTILDPAPPNSTALLSLQRFNRSRPIRLEIVAPALPKTVGHQYLLVVFPFGTLQLQDPQRFAYNFAFNSLTLAGFAVEQHNPSAPLLRIEMRDVRRHSIFGAIEQRVAAS